MVVVLATTVEPFSQPVLYLQYLIEFSFLNRDHWVENI